jgi:hypothetical protein
MQPSEESTFLQWSEGEDAFMRIDGKLEKLEVKHVFSKFKKPGEISIGDLDVYNLSNGSVRVKAYCTVSQICNPDDDACESTGYRAKITVKSPQGVVSIKASGACGC